MSKINEVIIKKEKTCALTGHRFLDSSFNEKVLLDTLVSVIESGFDTFLCGMAIGFDSIAFKVLYSLKDKYKIRIIACVPCLTQNYKFNAKQKQEYEDLIKKADDLVMVGYEYTPYCMMKRNMFMVDNASLVIAYLRKNTGGTANTVKYAENKKIKIVKL